MTSIRSELAKLNITDVDCISYSERLYQSLSQNAKKQPQIGELIAHRVFLELNLVKSESKPIDKRTFADLDFDISIKVLGEQVANLLVKAVWNNARPKPQVDPTPTVILGDQFAHGKYAELYEVKQIGEFLPGKNVPLAGKTIKSGVDSAGDLSSELRFRKGMHHLDTLTLKQKLKILPLPIEGKLTDGTEVMVEPRYQCDLKKYLENDLTLEQRIDLITQLLEQAYIYFGTANAVVTDLKLENVLVDTTSTPPALYLADLDNCHFDRSTLPKKGTSLMVNFTQSYILYDDAVDLQKGYLTDEAAFQAAVKQHASRAIGLMACEILLGCPSNLAFDTFGYSEETLTTYITENSPFSSLLDDHGALAKIIANLLIAESSIEEAWREWKKNIDPLQELITQPPFKKLRPPNSNYLLRMAKIIFAIYVRCMAAIRWAVSCFKRNE